ncbi:interleukin-1 receptor-associated kinase 4-like isoform X2 [Hemitrygon akajei]|uniref:interleukin-1 receptor-associated kinase 4-like isoform X2 n=1 Tax=Hemitrygon akajei TaxID=2704970 RepID=UPI003BF95073
MNNSLNPKSYIRALNHRLIRELSDLLDPQDAWKKLAVNIRKPSGELRYSQLHIRRLEGVVKMGKSPTTELLFDWGTTNTTVLELVEILIQNNFLAAANLLLPEEVSKAIPSCSPMEITTTSNSNAACKSMIQVSDHEATYHDTNCTTQQTALVANSSIQQNLASDSMETSLQSFSYYELMQRTSNFDERPVSCGGSKIGEGGFGIVYRGLINNRMVAVKKLAGPSHHHNISPEELKHQFLQEVKTLASANILLDALFVPKISDFGLARAASQLTQTVMTDKVVGTTAYMAPEALRGEITPKSDLFSFGVVLLEIITGLKAIDEHREPQLLLDIKEEIDEEEKTVEDYVDKKMHDWNSVSIKKMYLTARQCLHVKKNKRPSITEVYNSLKET